LRFPGFVVPSLQAVLYRFFPVVFLYPCIVWLLGIERQRWGRERDAWAAEGGEGKEKRACAYGDSGGHGVNSHTHTHTHTHTHWICRLVGWLPWAERFVMLPGWSGYNDDEYTRFCNDIVEIIKSNHHRNVPCQCPSVLRSDDDTFVAFTKERCCEYETHRHLHHANRRAFTRASHDQSSARFLKRIHVSSIFGEALRDHKLGPDKHQSRAASPFAPPWIPLRHPHPRP